MPAAARGGVPPLAAAPTGAGSRGRGASGRVGARRGPAPASVVPWCGASCGAQCGAHALGRRTAAARSLDGMRGVGGLRSGREQHARAPPRPLEGCCRAPRFEEECAHPSATSALWRGGGGLHSGCARIVARPRPAFLRRPLSGVRASAGCRGNPQWRAQPAGARKKRRVHSIAHLAGFARLGEDQSPGRGQISFFLFLGPKRNNFSNLSTPFSQKKCARCARCAVPFLPPPFVP